MLSAIQESKSRRLASKWHWFLICNFWKYSKRDVEIIKKNNKKVHKIAWWRTETDIVLRQQFSVCTKVRWRRGSVRGSSLSGGQNLQGSSPCAAAFCSLRYILEQDVCINWLRPTQEYLLRRELWRERRLCRVACKTMWFHDNHVSSRSAETTGDYCPARVWYHLTCFNRMTLSFNKIKAEGQRRLNIKRWDCRLYMKLDEST